MSRKVLLVLSLAVTCLSAALAQETSIGFRAGLSYATFIGPLEKADDGAVLENYRYSGGFHIGMSFNLEVTESFGARAELLFSQRGMRYEFDGDSYYFLKRGSFEEKLVLGRRITDMSVNQASLELPIMAYYRLGSFEILGGISVTGIVASSGGGGLEMMDVTSLSGNDVGNFEITMSHNYRKDDAGQAGIPNLPIEVDDLFILASSTTGAYYDYDVKNGSLYKAFDVGVTGGLSFYFNEGLYIGGRVTYGFIDVDDNQYDISYHRLTDANEYVYRADKNISLTIQGTLGFLF